MAASLEDRLTQDMKTAMKAGEAGKLDLSVIRLARAVLQNATIEKRQALSDDEAAQVVARQAKQRRASAEEYARLGKPSSPRPSPRRARPQSASWARSWARSCRRPAAGPTARRSTNS